MMPDSSPYLEWDSLRDFVCSASAEPLPALEDVRLADAAGRGDRAAADALIRHHLRMVVDDAAKHRDAGVSMDELVRRGVNALIGAARDFRRERHGEFTDYARTRIRASIREAVLHH